MNIHLNFASPLMTGDVLTLRIMSGRRILEIGSWGNSHSVWIVQACKRLASVQEYP